MTAHEQIDYIKLALEHPQQHPSNVELFLKNIADDELEGEQHTITRHCCQPKECRAVKLATELKDENYAGRR